MTKFYGSNRWDPKLIMFQMINLQTSHYLARGFFLLICHGLFVTMDQFFYYHAHTFSSVDGIKNCFAVFASSLVSAVCLCIFVERAKKCLDFGSTMLLIDLIITMIYGGFPNTWNWWLVHLISIAATILLGEYLCSRRELEEISMLDLFTRRAH